jgi:hypothetical protein
LYGNGEGRPDRINRVPTESRESGGRPDVGRNNVPRPAEGQVIRQEPRRTDDTPRGNSSPSRDERIGSRSEPQRTYTPPARESSGPSRPEQRVYEAPRVEHSAPRSEPRGDGGSMRSAPAPQRSAEPSHSAPPQRQSGSSNSGRSSESHESRTRKGDRN